MNELFKFFVPLLVGFMAGFSFNGWIKDIRSDRNKERRLIIDIPFERQEGNAVFKELQRWNQLIENRISHNQSLETDGNQKDCHRTVER